MRVASVVLVLTLLLPSAPAIGGGSGGPAASPLDLFGGGPSPLAWRPPALIVEVYYNTLRPDEYVTVANLAGAPLDLSGWTVTDLEGTLTFPSGSSLLANATIVVAENATAYLEDTLRPADFRYGIGNATPMLVSGRFQLANAGDEVLLRDPASEVVDAFAYGASTYAGPGWTGGPAKAVGAGFLARRASDGGWRDTNTSADWDLVRVWSLGQSDIGPASFAFDGTATAFVSPDGGEAPLDALIANATASIDLEVYTFTSAGLAADLRDALARGVRVRLLLEGGPVGGIDTDEWTIASGLAAEGASVNFMVNNTTRDIQERYRYVHAKYAILDARTVLISSENWGPSAFPPGPTRGSRGWSLAVTNASLAAYFERVFEGDSDARRRDVLTIAEMAVKPVAAKSPSTKPRAPRIAPRQVSGPFRVTPVLAPDTSLAEETILGAIGNATRTVHAELFYAYRTWDPFPDLYLDALRAAARRGVSVRVLLDSSPPNVAAGDSQNNTNTVASLNEAAASEGLDLQAKLVNLGAHGFTEVHNKGLVIDGRTVLVSSINWNRNSVTANREAGLLVENADLAAYFDGAFAWDWKDDVTPPRADAGPDRTADVGEPVTFSGLGSSDDVAVTNFSWDLDGDGTFDAWGAEVAHAYGHAGTYRVTLRVSDVWNNTANDSLEVTVVPAVPAGGGASPLWIVVPLLAVPLLAIWVRRRRRQRD